VNRYVHRASWAVWLQQSSHTCGKTDRDFWCVTETSRCGCRQ